MIDPSRLAPYAHYILPEAVIPELPGCYRGKVRENYDLADGSRVIIATDRISAFDRNLAVIPLKGQVMTQLSAWWFEQTKGVVTNHVISVDVPEAFAGRGMIVRKAQRLDVEAVVRGYLCGTGWSAYQRGDCEPSASTVGEMADELGCDPGDLYSHDERVAS